VAKGVSSTCAPIGQGRWVVGEESAGRQWQNRTVNKRCESPPPRELLEHAAGTDTMQFAAACEMSWGQTQRCTLTHSQNYTQAHMRPMAWPSRWRSLEFICSPFYFSVMFKRLETKAIVCISTRLLGTILCACVRSRALSRLSAFSPDCDLTRCNKINALIPTKLLG